MFLKNLKLQNFNNVENAEHVATTTQRSTAERIMIIGCFVFLAAFIVGGFLGIHSLTEPDVNDIEKNNGGLLNGTSELNEDYYGLEISHGDDNIIKDDDLEIEHEYEYEYEPIYISGLNTAQVGDIIEFGELKWRVLEVQHEKVLVISEYILEQRIYGGWGVTIWAESELRDYLNDEFYNNFNLAERQRILPVVIRNSDNPWFGTPSGLDTEDKIFLLSLDEVALYFGDSGRLRNRRHPDNERWGFHDQYSENRIARNTDGTVGFWWVRSPGLLLRDVAGISRDGYFHVSGTSTNNRYGGVRPAMWLKIIE